MALILSSKALDMRIYIWLISMLVKLNYQHACSLSLAWVGYDIEGLVKGPTMARRGE
jgi:hypothetical protein